VAAEAAARQAAAKVVEPHLKYAAQLVALVDMGFAGLVVYSIRQLIVAARLLLDSSVFLRCIHVLTNGLCVIGADERANLEALIETGGSVENAISRLLPS
jgi:hypothetical protein